MIYREIPLSGGATLTAYIQDSELHYNVFADKPAVIICPGGAYLIHATGEGEPVAMEFLKRGFQCFVLRYSVGADRRYPDRELNDRTPYPAQVLQLMEAMHLVYLNSPDWHIAKDKIFAIGFSAGGHVAASLAVHWNNKEFTRGLSFTPDEQELKPAGVILGYPMLQLNNDAFLQNAPAAAREQTALMYRTLFGTSTPCDDQIRALQLSRFVSKDTAPIFLWNCADDPVIESGHAHAFIQKLCSFGICCEYHMFSRGGHGQPLFNLLSMTKDDYCDKHLDPSLSAWMDLAVSWINSMEKIQK